MRPVTTTRTGTKGAQKPRQKAPDAAPTGSAAALLTRLKAWRAEQAREQGVPAYVILHDAALNAIATLLPRDLAALAAVHGIGAAKLARYGAAVLAIVDDESA